MAGAERLQRWLSECGRGGGAGSAAAAVCLSEGGRAGSRCNGGAGGGGCGHGCAGRAGLGAFRGSALRGRRADGAERSAPTLGSSRGGSALRFYADVDDDRFLPVAFLPFLPFTKRPRAERLVLSRSQPSPHEATDPGVPEENWECIQQFCRRPSRLLAHKIQSPQEVEALHALTVLETCVNNCGEKFHNEIAKFRFLNELIKVLSPKPTLLSSLLL
uniref:VHS domain-containing protein n=1 Tax=Pavo cristatus TaxID=9049 RepID=A0A8C9F0Z6_PAVCR